MARGKLKSKKLDRTILDLEAAFSGWENLSSEKKSGPAVETLSERELELKNKTKQLLVRLRQQLSELSQD